MVRSLGWNDTDGDESVEIAALMRKYVWAGQVADGGYCFGT